MSAPGFLLEASATAGSSGGEWIRSDCRPEMAPQSRTELDYLQAMSAPIYMQLKQTFPEVVAVNALYTHGLVLIVSTKTRYGGFAKASDDQDAPDWSQIMTESSSPCPRCRSEATEVRSRSPIAGVWTVFGCSTCSRAWAGSSIYDDVSEIVANGQTIVYSLHHSIGHLGIFVSGKVGGEGAPRVCLLHGDDRGDPARSLRSRHRRRRRGHEGAIALRNYEGSRSRASQWSQPGSVTLRRSRSIRSIPSHVSWFGGEKFAEPIYAPNDNMRSRL